MIKKQKALIIVCLVVIVALTVVYFAVVAPMLNKKPDIKLTENIGMECYNVGSDLIRVTKDKNGDEKWINIRTNKEYELPKGVESASAFTHLMFPTVELEDISELTVNNENGEFGFYQDEKGNFYLKDRKGTPYDNNAFTYLMVAARHPVVYSRMTEDISDLEKYGLDKDSSPAWYELTDKKGNSYKVTIGDLAPTEDRYYVMVDGVDAIYIADTEVNYLLRSAESYVLPILSYPTDSTEYYMTEEFILEVDGEKFMEIKYLSELERINKATNSYYEMLTPADYPVNSTNYDTILKKFTGFQGTETVAFGKSDEVLPMETLAQYGLDKPKYSIYYKYSGAKNNVWVSELQTDEETGESFYYAYSVAFNLVAKVSPLTLEFLSWDLLNYIDRPVLAHTNINNIQTIAIKGDGVDEEFTVAGSDEGLNIVCKSSGRKFSGDSAMDFRRFYKKLLEIALQDYTESKATDDVLMTLNIVTDADEEMEYIFYSTTSGHCYYTINGEGEFYVLRDRIERILLDTKTLASGGEITGEAT